MMNRHRISPDTGFPPPDFPRDTGFPPRISPRDTGFPPVRGVPITEYCDKNRLDAEAHLRLFITVCLAIQHAPPGVVRCQFVFSRGVVRCRA